MNGVKKYLTTVLTILMVVGQNIGGITAFAETLSSNNKRDIIEGLYFEKDNEKLGVLNLDEGEEATISLVDTDLDDESLKVILPENLEFVGEDSTNGEEVTINYNNQDHVLNIKTSKRGAEKISTFILKAVKSENSKSNLFAQVDRGETGVVNSQNVEVIVSSMSETINSSTSESNELPDESMINENSKDDTLPNNSESEISSETREVTSSSEIEKATNENEESATRLRRDTSSAKAATGDFSVTPPDSNIKITDQFVNNTDGNSNSYISERYPQAAALTPKESWQFGSIWSSYQLDLTKSFEYKSHVYLGERTGSDYNNTTAADGITFTLQNDPRGQSASGTQGGGLGAYGSGGDIGKPQDYTYIQNALSVELDTWYNNSARKNDQFDADIPIAAKNSGHIGLVRPGPGEPGGSKIGHLQYAYDVNSPLADNTWKELNIIWTPVFESGVLKADVTYSLGNISNTYRIEDVKSMFNGTKTYFGFTSSTGNNKVFQGVSIDTLPQRGFVYVNYKDIDTTENIDNEKGYSGVLGDKWVSEKKDFSNLDYQYIKVDGATSGEFAQDTQYVNYWYRKLIPKIEMNKTADKVNARVGEDITYTITAKNSGEGSWNGTITDKIPAEYVSLVSGTTTVNGEKVDDETVWKDNVLNVKQTIKAGGQVEVKFTVKATKDAKGQ
ncbi:DUF11 domain-containing protein, partial [Listeria monocytogenes]|nr:DUF11 domain-containing protein [Listeria monocytogenes]